MRTLSRRQAEDEQGAVADMSTAVHHDRETVLRRFAEDIGRPGFAIVVASEAGWAGCAYGYRVDPDGARWRGFLGDIPREMEELTQLGRVFAVMELMVLPEHRRRGVASRLMGQLLTGCDAALATVLTEPGNIQAHNAFVAWGWIRIGSLRADPATQVRDLWTHRLAR